MRRHPIFTGFVLCGCLLLAGVLGCSRNQQTENQPSKEKDIAEKTFMSIGSFSVAHLPDGTTRVRDGAGRHLILVPRDMEIPKGVEPGQVVRTPVRRVVAYGYFDIAILKALGVLEDSLVGVTIPKEKWLIPEVRNGMETGRITYLGDYTGMDIEKLHQIQPELVLTWDMSIIPITDEMKVPCAVTTTPVAMCLAARMKFIRFLAPFFNREAQAESFFSRISDALDQIRLDTLESGYKPKVIWGDIYEKRVLVEPGNAWVGQLVELALSDYLFEDVFGTSCIEISLERFLDSGRDADIFFTYRTPESGASSKAALARANPLLAGIKPIKSGRVYSPLPNYYQSGDRLDEILMDIAAILHPESYPGYRIQFFRELPDEDPAS